MLDTLSQLVRKPSKVSEDDLELTGWRSKQKDVLRYMENDHKLLKLLDEFRVANDKLKYIRSKKDVKIYFVEHENNGESYTYARCFFNINGRSKEFRKYLGVTGDLDMNRINQDELKEIFLRMLKNFLEY